MDDWRQLPKRPPAYIGPGGGSARQLGNSGAAWASKTSIDGAKAVRKGDYLYISTPDLTEPPILWMDLHVNATDDGRLYGLPVSKRQRTTRRHPGGFIANTRRGTPGPYNLYVGDGHVLKLVLFVTGDPLNPPAHVYALAELVRTSTSGKMMTVSYSEDQVPADDIDHIFFADKQEFSGEFPRFQSATAAAGAQIFASGYDPGVDAYRFGVYGFYRPYSNAWGVFKCFVGDTSSRRLQEVTLPIPEYTVNRFDVAPLNIISPAPGKLFSLWLDRVPGWRAHDPVQISFKKYPEPLKALRSDDHGLTWTLSDLSELTPHLLRLKFSEESEPIDDYPTDFTSILGMHTASAIGHGRIALVLPISNVYDTTVDPIPAGGMGGKFAPRLTHWGFFVSDASGANFVKKPWPMDGRPAITAPWDMAAATAPDYSGALYNNPFGWALGGSTLTAGPGSFFIVTSAIARALPPTEAGRFPTQEDLLTAGMRVLWTVDYGDTWAFSDFLPQELRSSVSDDLNERDYLPSVNFTVIRPYVDEADPGLLAAVVLRAGQGARLWRTDARFSRFVEVGVVAKGVDSSFSVVRSANQNALFVGSSAVRAPMRPGYPEFDRPQP